MKTPYLTPLVSLLVGLMVTTVYGAADGPIGIVQQPLVAGYNALVNQKTQEEFGLLTLTNPTATCSASMLNDYWAITAAHCVFFPVGCPTKTTACTRYRPNQISLQANWPGNNTTAQVLRIIPYTSGPWRPTDIALLQVGLHDFNRPNYRERKLHNQRPMANLTVKAFGRGINRLAFFDANGKAQQTVLDGQYRSAAFDISSINPNSSAIPQIYSFPSKKGAIIAGGDSGGPSYIQEWDIPTSPQRKLEWRLIGVHSNCDTSKGCLSGKACPVTDPWTWVASIKQCSDAAILPVRNSILRTIQTVPTEQNFIGTFATTPPNYQPIWAYVIQYNGDLIWYRKDNNASNWLGPKRVGTGWQDFKDVIPAGGNRFYALTKAGKLNWYQHNGFNDGSFDWKGPVQIGTGWGGFSKIFSGGDGLIYAIQTDGKLLWYRDLAYQTGGGLEWWQGPKTVGYGWSSFKEVFSMGQGVIYAVKNDGTLLWYRHKGYENGGGLETWSSPNVVGSQWQQFKSIVPVGNGGILAVTFDGQLLLYVHKNYLEGIGIIGTTGSGLLSHVKIGPLWEGPFKIGTGWQGFKDIVASIPQSVLTPPL